MKKILLTTTALVSLAAGAAMADATVKVGGELEFMAAAVNQKVKRDLATSGFANHVTEKNKFGFDHKTNVSVDFAGKTDFGLGYGAHVDLEEDSFYDTAADNTEEEKSLYVSVKRSSVFVESGAGRFEMGNTEGADINLALGAQRLARGNGGIDGDMDRFIYSGGDALGYDDDLLMGRFLTSPTLYAGNDSHAKRANKISYYTPNVNGLQAGISYAPDLSQQGHVSKVARYLAAETLVQSYATEVISGGVRYQGQFDQFGVGLSATGTMGKAKKMFVAAGTQNSYNKLRGMEFGGQVSYAGFAVAGSYGDLGKSLTNKTLVKADAADYSNQNAKTKYYTVGASYVQGPVGVSVTYLNSKRFRNDFDNIAVAADYQLAPGFMPYVEANFFNAKSVKETADATRLKNDGTVVLVGTKLKF